VIDPTPLLCIACGTTAVPGDLYCEICGAPLVDPARAGSPCVACGEAASEIQDGYCRSCGRKQPAARDSLTGTDGNGEVAAVTDRGRRRRRNEDAFAISATPDGRVMAVVSDGVSSTTDSDLASQQAAEAAVVALRAAGDREPADALDDAYRAALEAASNLPDSSGSPPSCTFLALIATLYSVDLASMGDCRAFWLPEEGRPQTLTEDDSWAAAQVTAGRMTVAQAHADPKSHGITRWLGCDADPSWEPRRVQFTAPGPGRLVLCSDGLWNYTPDARDVARAAGVGSPTAIASRLVEYAKGRGGQDNITVVVVAIPCGTNADASKGPPT
jgi:serine/threonine protein phosphatase PrpC